MPQVTISDWWHGSHHSSQFGGETGELWQALTAQTMLMINSSPTDGVNTSGMAILGAEQTHVQVGSQLLTSRGAVKAELMSNGMLQTSLEGFSPLPFTQFNTQLAFVPAGLAGGVVQGMLMTPVGMLMGCANTGGQLSSELLTGMQPSPTSQLLLGVHTWGIPGLRCGTKIALEWQVHRMATNAHGEPLTDEPPLASSTVTLACTSPAVTASGAPLTHPERSASLSIFHRLSAAHSLAATLEWPAKAEGQLTIGGTRQISERARVRGKWGTSGVLAFALEVAGEKCVAPLAHLPVHRTHLASVASASPEQCSCYTELVISPTPTRC